MSGPGFRARFFSPTVWASLRSPFSFGLLAVVSVIGVLAGIPVFLAVGIGVVAYALKVLVAVPRNPRQRPIDPFTISEPWRRYVQAALSAKSRFDRTVAATSPGPIRQRLGELSERLDRAVQDSWRIASKGDEIDAALDRLNTRKAEMELERLRSIPGDDIDRAAAVESLEATIASGNRMKAVSAATRDQLALLDARLDELVARAGEVSVGAGDGAVLGTAVDELVTDLEGLRLALETTRGTDAPAVGFGEQSATEQPATEQPAPEQQSMEKPQTWPPQ